MKEWELAKETWLHRVNPSLKLGMALLVCIVVLFVRNLEMMAFIGIGLLLLFLLFTGQPLKRILLLLIPFCAIFVSTASAMILFGNGQTLWFEWGLIRITEESFLRGMLIGLRAFVFAVLGLTFALTTRPVNLFYSLMQQLRLDPKYAYSFMAALRLIPIMTDEFDTIRNARKVRGGESARGLRGILFKMKVYTIPLLSGSIRRAHRIAVAMEAKRFSGKESRTYYYDFGFSGNDVLFLAYMLLLVVMGYWTKRWIG
ncbi:energy-coupling factor transport system permease protein [Trichococcus patagoniensis]|uniref:Energy-coupling factor transport system permease protein n=1 Tax=Trichococcus patagoniensis TaxID=382641 RepID=A0A2T5INW3_9LACT|nr:energy-coupling factor transporter transmembrane component T [Trichococcus patagoniensis]PTQ85504.1 energy-coupling factor transport system permease protein [Trichococcus patagoniensis]